MQWLIEFGKPCFHICDISEYLLGVNESRDILFEAQLGALVILTMVYIPTPHPQTGYTHYRQIPMKLIVIGIMKAYSSVAKAHSQQNCL